MNEKLKYRYNEVKTKLLELENDTRQTIDSQLSMLAEKTDDGIEKYPNLKESLLEESDLLSEASEIFRRVAEQTERSSDVIKTAVKDTQSYSKRKMKNPLLLRRTNLQIDYQEVKDNHFAQGKNFYKLFWIFFIGSFAGVILEMLYCLFQRGHIESRVGLIYGPFNLVYGLGALALTIFLYQYRNRSNIYSFIGGFLVGSVIEYLCSYFQEMVFGSVSWDYSNMPFNINGRICLLYSLFWGILGVLWIKEIYPWLAYAILKIPDKIGKVVTIICLVFMIYNSAASGIVAYRWSQRVNGNPPTTFIGTYIDQHYPNERMERIFPNLTFVKK